MRAGLIALITMFGSQAGADDAKLNPDEWTFLKCKHAEGFPLKLSDLPMERMFYAVKNDESSIINMGSDIHFDTCRAELHTDLVCSEGDGDDIILNRFSGHLYIGPSYSMICEKLDGPLF